MSRRDGRDSLAFFRLLVTALALELHRAIFHANGLAFDEGFRDSAMCTGQDPSHSLSRNTHLLCCLFLVHPVEIGQADRLDLVQRQYNFVKIA